MSRKTSKPTTVPASELDLGDVIRLPQFGAQTECTVQTIARSLVAGKPVLQIRVSFLINSGFGPMREMTWIDTSRAYHLVRRAGR